MSKDSEKLATLTATVESALKDRDEIVKRSDKIHEKYDETNNTIMKQLKEFGEKLEKIGLDIAVLPDELTKRFDERYATKKSQWAESLLKWLGIIIGTGVLGYLGILIVKLIEM